MKGARHQSIYDKDIQHTQIAPFGSPHSAVSMREEKEKVKATLDLATGVQ